MSEPQVVIIGGGFSGAAVAIHLMREAGSAVGVTVVEPRATPGAGVAYSTTDPAHRINVPASRMQLSGAEEGEFDRWYRQQPAFADDSEALRPDGAIWPQRSQFGRYVAEKFAAAVRQSGGRLTHLQDRAVAWSDNAVVTASGRVLPADVVVLAISHPPPELPRLTLPVADHPALIANPWQPDSLAGIARNARVALMGTALTMADVVASLSRQGHSGPVVAFSRRGLLSRSNLSGSAPEWPGDYTAGTLRQRVRLIRDDIRRACRGGQSWQSVLDAVRNQGQTIWQQLSLADRQRFLRHLRSYWDVHRYRVAPQVSEVIAARQANGSLRVLAARLQALLAGEKTLTLKLRTRGGETLSETVDHLILTTGPAHGALLDSQPLLRDLARQGMIRPDAIGLGIDVDARSRAVGHDGRVTPGFLVAGPAARGRFGELMGLPQVADHAATVAREVLEILPLVESIRTSVS